MGVESRNSDRGARYGRADNDVDVVIIGAGISVWGHLYSYSFEPNPDWSCEYPSQGEIQKYLIKVAHKWHLYEHMRFNTAVEEARWDSASCKWRVRVRQQNGGHVGVSHDSDNADDNEKNDDFAHAPSSYTLTANFVVSAVGQLSIPKRPNIPGLDTFRGKVMHSARWDWDYDLTGKRVGVIGTGSTAAQIIPAIAPHARRLVVFQRSPTWVMPRHDAAIGQLTRLGYRYVPGLLKRRRAQLMDVRESHFVAGFDQKSAEHQSVSEKSRQHLQTQLAGSWNAELRCKLTPRYPFNCKRIIVSDDYYPALARDNVWLETAGISHITDSGVALAHSSSADNNNNNNSHDANKPDDGNGTQQQQHHDLDVLILATGFQTTRFTYPIRIHGRNGHSLSATWNGPSGASAYLGITVPDFPNLGMLYGPNTNLAYNSLILQIEAQSAYISRLIGAVLSATRAGKTLAIEPRPDVVAAYNDEVQTRLAKSTFADARCSSWFKTANGRITNNWCGSAIEYQVRTSVIDWEKEFVFEGDARGEWAGRRPTRWERVREEGRGGYGGAGAAGAGEGRGGSGGGSGGAGAGAGAGAGTGHWLYWRGPLAQSVALMVSSGLAIACYKSFGASSTLLPLPFG